ASLPKKTGLSANEVIQQRPEEETAPTPQVIVEKTAENQPSFGETVTAKSTEAEKEAFEKRQADATPDKEVTVSETGDVSVLAAGVLGVGAAAAVGVAAYAGYDNKTGKLPINWGRE